MVFGAVNTQVRRFLLLVFPDQFAIERRKARIRGSRHPHKAPNVLSRFKWEARILEQSAKRRLRDNPWHYEYTNNL
ncbi:MAG: hypothetical protein IPH35_01960 [Rhodoferax sp.]|nr:hypothetical protein [Rhodoferax sp.]